MQKFQIFDSKVVDEEIENEFHAFFYNFNLTALFTNEHRAGSISVSYVDMKSVLNEGGKNRKTLLEFADILSMANDNKTYEEAIFKLIHDSRSFQGLMNNIKKYLNFIKQIEPEHMFNMWNVVWYAKELK